MNTYGLMLNIERQNNSKYTGYTKTFKWSGQEFPALRDLVGKLVILRNGERGFATQSSNRIVVFVDGKKEDLAYGRRFTAYQINSKGNVIPSQTVKDKDIMSVLDADGNIFWERKTPLPKEKPVHLSMGEVERLLRKLYKKDVVVDGNTSRKVKTVVSILEQEPLDPEVTARLNETPEQRKVRKATEKYVAELKEKTA